MDQDTTRNLILLAIAAFQALTAWLTSQTRKDMRTLEQNTNSKMDQLLVSTASASEAKGRDEQRVIGETAAAALAKGNSTEKR